MSKSKLKNLKTEDGELTTPIDKTKRPKYQTVDQLLGWQGEGTYFTKDHDEYQRNLEGMGITDLQREAASRSLTPINDKKRLITRLMNQFDKHWAQFVVLEQPKSKIKNEEELKKILSAGR